MLRRILADPPLEFALLLCAATIAGGIVTFIFGLIEARRTRFYNAFEAKRDAHTAERRAKLQLLQRRERREKEIA